MAKGEKTDISAFCVLRPAQKHGKVQLGILKHEGYQRAILFASSTDNVTRPLLQLDVKLYRPFNKRRSCLGPKSLSIGRPSGTHGSNHLFSQSPFLGFPEYESNIRSHFRHIVFPHAYLLQQSTCEELFSRPMSHLFCAHESLRSFMLSMVSLITTIQATHI